MQHKNTEQSIRDFTVTQLFSKKACFEAN